MNTDVLLRLLTLACAIGLGSIAAFSFITGLRNIIVAKRNGHNLAKDASLHNRSSLSLKVSGVRLCFLGCMSILIAGAIFLPLFTRQVLIIRLMLILIAALFAISNVFLRVQLPTSQQDSDERVYGKVLLLIGLGICFLLGPNNFFLLKSPLSSVLLIVDIISAMIFLGSFVLLRRR